MIREFNRYEQKYVMPISSAWRFRDALQPYMAADEHAGSENCYYINSLYFDSADLHCYWEKLDGLKFRRKVRMRSYGRGSSENCFLEIKQRIDKTVQKRRTKVATGDALNWLSQGAKSYDSKDPVCSEVEYLRLRYELKPALYIGYRREAYVGRYDPSLRITFDTDLVGKSWTHEDGGLLRWGNTSVLPVDYAVLEIKFDNYVPLWVCELVGRHEIETCRMSKYCSAVDVMSVMRKVDHT